MAESILNGKRILAVDDEPDVLDTLEDLLSDYEDLVFDRATNYETGYHLIRSWTYDIVILDIMGVRGFDLLEIAHHRGFPVVMLTAHALNPEALKQSIELGARAFIPKDQLASIPEFLEDVLKLSYRSVWRTTFDGILSLFNERFGSNWRKSEQEFWTEFERTLRLDEPAIHTFAPPKRAPR